MPRIKVYVVNLSTKAKPRPFLYFQWVDPTTGKRRTKSSKCSRHREAERAAVAFEKRLNSLQPTGEGAIGWEDFVVLYHAEHLSSLEDSSNLRVTSALNVFTKLVEPQRLGDITSATLSEYAATLRAKGRAEATLATHGGILHTAFEWAKQNGHIESVPKFPRIAKKRLTRAKGRPLTLAEFVLLLRATSGVVGRPAARSWRRLLIGLWLSGLRLDEALSLTWGDGVRHESALWIDTSGKYPLLGITAESEKGKQDRLLPITPDFGRWLLKVPKAARDGYVFKLVKRRRQQVRRLDHMSKTISEIGAASKVRVNAKGKYASAHDLRRSFGLRWSHRVMPAELQQLMRHSDISTTMNFYAMIEASNFAERLWNQEKNSTPNSTLGD